MRSIIYDNYEVPMLDELREVVFHHARLLQERAVDWMQSNKFGWDDEWNIDSVVIVTHPNRAYVSCKTCKGDSVGHMEVYYKGNYWEVVWEFDHQIDKYCEQAQEYYYYNLLK